MNRRTLIKTMAGAVSATAVFGHDARAEESRSSGGIKAIAFDAFVIFDPRTVEKRVIEEVPDVGADLANLWRTRQFEYCWLRTAGGQYADFWQVTSDALRYAAKSLKISLSVAQHETLMDAYRNLQLWPDVRDGLMQLRQLGIRMAFLTNFTAAMLDTNLKAARLSDFFEPHLTTDRVNAYKPSPRAYEMGPAELGLPKRAIAFAASAAWDAAGAKRFGYPTVWVNRGGIPQEELDVQPEVNTKDLSGLIKFAETP